MTEEQLKEIERHIEEDFSAWNPAPLPMRNLIAEVRRLRRLIYDAESDGAEPYAARRTCPWCATDITERPRHSVTCAAFADDGVVR